MLWGGLKMARGDELPDLAAEHALDALLANGAEEFLDVGALGVGEGRGLLTSPALYFLEVEETDMNAIDEVVQAVGGVVSPVHDLTFDRTKAVACFARPFAADLVPGIAKDKGEPGFLRVIDEMVVRLGRFVKEGFVFEDAIEEGARGIHARLGALGGIGIDAFRQDAQGLRISFKAT